MGEEPMLLIALLLLHMILEFGVPIWHFRSGASGGVASVLGKVAIRMVGVALILGLGSRHWPISCVMAVLAALSWWLVTTCSPRIVKNSTVAFILAQLTHIVSLAAAWTIAEGRLDQVPDYVAAIFNVRVLAILLAYVTVMRPASTLIASMLNPWLPTINNGDSLKSAGTLIGYLERILILTFVLLQRWEAIGFLLAAKSILRFNEIQGKDQRPMSEYVLLGTLLSVTIAIAAGLLLSWALKSWTPPDHAAAIGSSLKKLLSAI